MQGRGIDAVRYGANHGSSGIVQGVLRCIWRARRVDRQQDQGAAGHGVDRVVRWHSAGMGAGGMTTVTGDDDSEGMIISGGSGSSGGTCDALGTGAAGGGGGTRSWW